VDEAEDRFGPVPKTMQRLMRVALIKAMAHKAYITFLRYRQDRVEYIIKDGAPIDVAKVSRFIKKYKGDMRLITAKESGFSVKTSSLVQDNMLEKIEEVINDINENLIIRDKDE
ncbi:MAG: TRCF domain-containing protein, partial [Eubacterium sp.]|nr:TRCF domain-containing protein [Eubacterium sp.]